MSDFDPYKVLGVRRNASRETIRKAFKKKVLKAHPDVGGTAEAFAELQQAAAILSDPKRRQKYDDFGFVDQKSELELAGKALALLSEIFNSLLNDSDIFNPTVDVVASMKRILSKEIVAGDKIKTDTQANIYDLEALKDRIVRKDGHNFFVAIIENRITRNKKMLVDIEDKLAVAAMAQTELGYYQCIMDEQIKYASEYEGFKIWRSRI